jgi:uncharacterized membrane protein YczE
MQTFFLWFLLLIIFSLGVYLELQYAHAGYPNDWRWKVALFIVGGFVIGLGGYLVTKTIDKQPIPPILHLLAIIFGGAIFTWVFPVRMRYVIPPKRKHDP